MWMMHLHLHVYQKSDYDIMIYDIFYLTSVSIIIGVINPLNTNGFFILVWYNIKLGMVHYTYLGVSGYKLQNILFSIV